MENAADYEERYIAFIQNSTEGIWRFDTDEPVDTALPEDEQIEAFYRLGYLAEANDAFARMYGYEHGSQLVGARVSDLLVKEDPQNREYLQAFVRSGYRLADAQSVETDRDGCLRYFSNTLTGILRDGKLFRAWGTQRDVTSQTLAEHRREEAITALQESEERLRLALASGGMGTWDADLTSGTLTLSEEIAPLYGRPLKEIVVPFGEWLTWMHGGDRKRVSAGFAAALRGAADFDVQFRSLWPDGVTCRWIATRALITRDTNGTPVRAVGYTRDITREKEQEEEREALLTRQRGFMREFVFSLTEGKFRLCLTEADLPAPLPAVSEILPLTIPTLRALRQRLMEVTEDLGFTIERAQDIETAVGEAAMNAATHGGGGEGTVHADPERGIIQIRICDRGTGISEEALPLMIRKGVSSAGTLGHGFWLILGTCDRVSLLSGPNGTTLVLEQERTPPEPSWLQSLGT